MAAPDAHILDEEDGTIACCQGPGIAGLQKPVEVFGDGT
jgi:hypothetical protein